MTRVNTQEKCSFFTNQLAFNKLRLIYRKIATLADEMINRGKIWRNSVLPYYVGEHNYKI